MPRARSTVAIFLGCVIALAAEQSGLTSDEIKMLEDPGGWQYISVTDPDNGIQTTHTCFDGEPHPGVCSGTLTLRPDGTFVKDMHIHGESVQRHGTFKLDGNQISFYDEFGTRDGPYTVVLNSESKLLDLTMPSVHIELELEKQYREDLKAGRKPGTKNQ